MRFLPGILVTLALTGCGATTSPADSGVPSEDAGSSVDAGITFPECGPAPLPTPCDDSASTAPAAGDFGSTGAFAVTVETLPNPRPSAPRDVSIYLPTGVAHPPVFFFSHAFGATDPAIYDALFRNLASNGYAVVQVAYPTLPGGNCQNTERYAALWEGFDAAATHYASRFDLTKVGFIGHSFGGGATPEMARKGFLEKGWGSAGRFMFILAPWYSWGSGYETIPANTKVVLQVYADDEANEHAIAVEDVWNKLPGTLERAWILLRTDTCGSCGLNAPHSTPMQVPGPSGNPQNVLNGMDRWGVFRRIQALAKYAFEADAAARPIAFGEDTAMGNWVGCGGRAVRPLEASTTPLTSACISSPMYLEANRAANADTGITCR